MDHDRRGTGIAVASNTEATDGGKGRSLKDEEEEDLRDEADGLEGVRVRASRCTGVREPRFGGIITGVVMVEPGIFSTLLVGRRPRWSKANVEGRSFRP